MNCIVTAGPTYEELDEVRRLTNFSTGKLESELANYLSEQGHEVTLFLGHYSTYNGEQKARHLHKFTTTQDLRDRLLTHNTGNVNAIFHAAAVSDFGFGKVYNRDASGALVEVQEKKISTRGGQMFAELVPTPKILGQLRTAFPRTCIVGWKYEVDGSRPDALKKAERQLSDNGTDACVANGPAYGFGFGLVESNGHRHLPGMLELFAALLEVAKRKSGAAK